MDRAEEIVYCPYDVAHSMPRKSLAQHLQKCRKNNEKKASLMRKCRFNITHLVPEHELKVSEQF